MSSTLLKRKMRLVRQTRVRKRISGTPERLRLNVYRSNKHIYAQVIDDTQGKTVCSTSSLSPDVTEQCKGKNKKEQAVVVGKHIAELCKKANITKVVFDRAGLIYHGRVKALAEGARENGLEF